MCPPLKSRFPLFHQVCLVGLVAVVIGFSSPARSDEPSDAKTKADRPKRVLLLGQKPDGHPFATHEYMAGVRLLATLLNQGTGANSSADVPKRADVPNRLQTVIVQADGAWPEGPELLDGADGAVLFLAEGARWVSEDPARLEAFRRLAKRKGGLACLHWAMGAREAGPVAEFVALFGRCHGGPDRKYKLLKEPIRVSPKPHPVTTGITPFDVVDEFYYSLKRPEEPKGLHSLWEAPLDGKDETVAWAYERPEGGRSFGFSGLHIHDNWRRTEYRRLVVQGVLWSLGESIPEDGVTVEVTEADIQLPPRESSSRKESK